MARTALPLRARARPRPVAPRATAGWLSRTLAAVGLSGSRGAKEGDGTDKGTETAAPAFEQFDRVLQDVRAGSSGSLVAVDVPGDGNCLFASIAVSHAVAHTGKLPDRAALAQHAQQLRLQANDLLCPGGNPSPDEINGFPLALVMEPAPGEDGCGYCARLRQNGQWGSAAEILALSQVLHCPIAVYHRPLGSDAPEEMDTYGREEAGRSVPILYLHGSHYTALVPGQSEPSASGAGGAQRARL